MSYMYFFCLHIVLSLIYSVCFFCFISPGSEGICSGTYLPNVICLVHGKITQSLEIWIKTPSSLLTDALAKHFQTVLK